MPSPQPDAQDVRRLVPRTDAVLADPEVQAAVARLGRDTVRAAVNGAQGRARAGQIAPDEVVEAALAALPARATTLTPVINATGVVIHTNLGRAPLSEAAVEAMAAAAGTVDVELDLRTGKRSKRGRGTLAALLEVLPEAGGALVVNNGAAALVLATTALAAGREVVVSRGEMVEIGDGFRLPDLIASTGARLREVGTTNRTTLADYAAAVGPDTGCILKVHPSNFRVEGFTASASVVDLAGLGVPVVHDIGSGLLRPHPLLPDEPDAASALAEGAAIVTCSGDKLLGGPQAGLVLGDAATVETLRRHPLARALRADKTTLAGLEATVRGPRPPVWDALEADPDRLRARCAALVATLPTGSGATVVAADGVVGGGGAPGRPLPGWAVALPEACAELLRGLDEPVLARVERGRCLVDPRCVPESLDRTLTEAVREVLGRLA
ncbi:L-seryl-tRNA(Sec) selenium transferase [Phycicoccus sp. Soil748]|uniref:L-seryl-tRNA(Sec) selenium transferase n=1 Tax=Phycicoccus sp. Soil748 TaxID=1736397 RepID=UPI00070306B8|nr:L-seryl-tRNA(Sec) selenium transferase [Phycicoccus sp. Soil748]KRE56093.1 L-selenocysteinyl-tRNA(Sec) synthase [Phycicoccus sp. Soil748]